MADITITANQVRPLNGALIYRFPAASTDVAVGKVVYVKSDGKIELADADDGTAAQARGIVVGIGVHGASVASVDQACDVVLHGPVAIGATGLTDGAAVFVSTTAGAMDQTAPAASGDFKFAIGWALSDSVIMVQPQIAVPVANTP